MSHTFVFCWFVMNDFNEECKDEQTAAHSDSSPLIHALRFEAFHELKASIRTELSTHI